MKGDSKLAGGVRGIRATENRLNSPHQGFSRIPESLLNEIVKGLNIPVVSGKKTETRGRGKGV